MAEEPSRLSICMAYCCSGWPSLSVSSLSSSLESLSEESDWAYRFSCLRSVGGVDLGRAGTSERRAAEGCSTGESDVEMTGRVMFPECLRRRAEVATGDMIGGGQEGGEGSGSKSRGNERREGRCIRRRPAHYHRHLLLPTKTNKRPTRPLRAPRQRPAQTRILCPHRLSFPPQRELMSLRPLPAPELIPTPRRPCAHTFTCSWYLLPPLP